MANLCELESWIKLLISENNIWSILNEQRRSIQKKCRDVLNRISNMNYNNISHPWDKSDQVYHILDQNFWNDIIQLSHYEKEKQNSNSPHIDVFDTFNKIIVSCEIARLDLNSLKLNADQQNQLTISGNTKKHVLSDYCVSKEQLHGDFTRVIQLPGSVCRDGVQNSYIDDVLEIHFLKE